MSNYTVFISEISTTERKKIKTVSDLDLKNMVLLVDLSCNHPEEKNLKKYRNHKKNLEFQ